MKFKQLNKEQAIQLADSKRWKNWTDKQRFVFQINQNKLCMDFSQFHKSTEKVLGRPVWTHEFAHPENLIKEFLGIIKKPSMEEIIDLLPQDKLIILEVKDE